MNYQVLICSLVLICCTLASAYFLPQGNLYGGQRAVRNLPYYPGGVRYYYGDVDDDYYQNRYYQPY